MSLVRLLPAWLHAIADYAVGTLLIVIALIVGGSGTAVATGVVVGVVVLVVSALTKYPLGIKKVLPFTLHSAGDYLAAALLIAAPFALNFNHSDTGLTALYLVFGGAVVAVSLVTNYQYSDELQAAPAAVVASLPTPVAAKASTKPSTKPGSKTTTTATRRTRPLVADRSARAKA